MQKKSVQTIVYSTAGILIMAVILVAFNVITSAVHRRVDLTKEKAYTLSAGTRAILDKLDTPVKIRFYCSQKDLTSPYAVALKDYARNVQDLLDEYREAARGKISVEKLDPQPDTDAEDSANLDGIEAQQLPGGERFYLGLAVIMAGDIRQSIPFLPPDRERQLEYDISRAISRAMTPAKPVVGVMSALPVFGAPANPMMEAMGQGGGQQPWAIIQELRQDYDVKNVPMDADSIDDNINVLLVVYPKEISDKAQYAIDQFVLRGGRLIAFMDAQSLVDSRGQNPMMGQAPGGGGSLDKLVKAWGLQFDTSKVVADENFKMILSDDPTDPSAQRPVWLKITPVGINTNDIITSELDDIWMFASGAFTGTPAAGLKETVLLKSTGDSQLVDGMMASLSGSGVLRDFKPSGVEYALAVKLSGKFKSAFPDGAPEEKKDETKPDEKPGEKPKTADNSLKESKADTTVVLVGDSDMIYDGYSLRQLNTPFGQLAEPLNANLNFALNAVEQLSGDSNLIAVRSRATIDHPFTRVRAIEAAADEQYLAKIKELEDSKEQTQSRLNELQQQKGQSQRYVVSPEQQAEIDNLQKKAAQVSRDLREVEKNQRRDIVSLERRIEIANIAGMPALVILVGIVLAVYKSKHASAK
jgi:ABC-type uncharacterized transport system involved in gliding motility auxiliary subunit